MISNQVVSDGLEWAPEWHSRDTNGTERAQNPGLPESEFRLKFREKILFSHQPFRTLLEQNHTRDSERQGADYADKHLLSLYQCLHFGRLNLSTADSESIDHYADRLAALCAAATSSESMALDLQAELLSHEMADDELRKLSTVTWWRRKIYQRLRESRAHLKRACGFVHNKLGPYVDGDTITGYRVRCAQTRAYLESTQIENSIGQRYTLAEIADVTTSNPVNRRAEMMTELRGYSEWARSQGDSPIFITLTTPSSMHRCHNNGRPNTNYDGASPAVAQEYLNQVWQRTRAQLARDSIKVYGMRVAEPHHDGTPHWHLLLFVDPTQLDELVSTIRDHALQQEPQEAGAQEHRITFTYCDYSKGDPVSYMAKYVSKNIDGFAIETDDNGHPMATANERVRAWASTYRIRQFQFFGGPSVTIWRTLRKLKQPLTKENEDIRLAADQSDFRRYIELMGGMCCKRSDRPIQLASIPSNIDVATGEIDEKANATLRQYLRMDDVLLPCSFFQWTIVPRQTASYSVEHPIHDAVGEGVQIGIQHGPLGLVSITVRDKASRYLLPNRNHDPE